MTEHTVTSVEPGLNELRKTVEVKAPQDVAWRVFTTAMGTWWPIATHKIGKVPAVDVVIEPRVGGRWYERGGDGSSCNWGRVLAWEPTSRLVLSWEISADWQPDPNLETEVEVRFIAVNRDRTRVELSHRRLERFGTRRDEMRGVFDSDGGWGGLLAAFASAAEKA
jgi:uncharacterized protein YndB with AHSA1/START domain